jgi:hypothetical protein
MRIHAVNMVSVAFVLAGTACCAVAAWAFADASDLAGVFWGTLAAAMLAASVRMAGRR